MQYRSILLTLLSLITIPLALLANGASLGIAYLDTGLIQSGDSTAINRVVEVIDSMRMPIVALYGVEELGVVEQISNLSDQDYCHIHRTMDYYNGQDFALLYFGDRLFIESVSRSSSSISIEGEVDGRSVTIHLTRRGDRLRSTLPHNSTEASDITILCGRASRSDLKRLKLYDAMTPLERQGYGNARKDNRWFFRNRIGCSVKSRGGVYITDWLATRKEDLPIYLIIDTLDAE